MSQAEYLTQRDGSLLSVGGSSRTKQCLVASWMPGESSDMAFRELRHEVIRESDSTTPDKNAACKGNTIYGSTSKSTNKEVILYSTAKNALELTSAMTGFPASANEPNPCSGKYPTA